MRAVLAGFAVATAAAAAGVTPSHADPDELAPRPESVRVLHEPRGELPVIGPRVAPVTIDVFFDPGYKPSRTIYHHLLALAERHPTRLRIVFRPVPQSRQQSVGYASEAVLEAFAQGRFRDYMHALGGVSTPLPDALVAAAEKAGLDAQRLRAVLEAGPDGPHRAVVDDNVAFMARRRIGLNPPVLLFNGVAPTRTHRNLTVDQLERHYDEAYARARDALAEGVPLAELYDELLRRVDAEREPTEIKVGLIDGVNAGADRTDIAPRPRLLAAPIDTSGLIARGPEDARVEVVLLCNFASQLCGNTYKHVERAVAAYPDDVRVFVHPLFDDAAEGSSRARVLHEAALCVEQEHGDLFWTFYEQAIIRGQQVRRNTTDQLRSVLNRIPEIDEDRLFACIESGTYAELVDVQAQRARAAGIRYTPSVVIGGRLYIGTKSQEVYQDAIAAQLAPGVLDRWFPEWRMP